MTRIRVFLLVLTIILPYLELAEAKEGAQSKRLTLWIDVGHTVPTNNELKAASGGGKASYSLRFEYCLAQSYLSPSIGFQVGRLPLDGARGHIAVDPGGSRSYPYTKDWSWTNALIYVKVESDRAILTPYAKAGLGLYYLNLKIPLYPEVMNISRSYLGYNMGFGFEVLFGKWPVSLFAELDFSLIPINPSISLPESREVSSAKILNPLIGLGFSF